MHCLEGEVAIIVGAATIGNLGQVLASAATIGFAILQVRRTLTPWSGSSINEMRWAHPAGSRCVMR
jgi:hypothetical protein